MKLSTVIKADAEDLSRNVILHLPLSWCVCKYVLIKKDTEELSNSAVKSQVLLNIVVLPL